MDVPRIGALTAFFGYDEAARARLGELRPLLEKNAENLVGAFYDHLLSFPETRRLLRDEAVAKRLRAAQHRYLLSLAGPEIDDEYVAERQRIGDTHERIGLEPRWYLGAYALYLRLLTPLVLEHAAGDHERAEETLAALHALVLIDSQIAMTSYIDARERELEFANQELSRSGRRLAADLRRSDAELRRTSERARAAEHLASIGTLVAGLAHEIGTPMGVIQGHASLLEPALRDHEQGMWRLRTIREQIDRIAKIIQSLLNMARPNRAARSPLALAPLVDAMLSFLSERFERHDIQVERDYAEVPAIVGDKERLQQVFLNLLMNAADAMDDGGTLSVSIASLPDDQVEVRIADDGPGFSEGVAARIFQPFFTTKEAGQGHGLGLSVVQGIVTEHHGTIEAVDVDPHGAMFRIVLPSGHSAPDAQR